MSNLVESVKGYFSEELVGRLVPFLGVEAEKVQSIVDAGIGALASEFPSFAESGGLAAFTGLTTNADFDGKWQPEGGLISLAGQGKPVLETLLGDRKDEVVAQVAAESGAKGEAVEKALCIVSPALMIAAAGMAVEKPVEAPVEAPKAPQKKRITVGNLEEVQEAVVATAEAPAPAPLNIPIAEPESPVATTPSVSAAPATAKAPTRLLPAIAAVICTVVLGATVLMKGCGAAPAETQPAAQSTSQPTTQPASAEPKLEDPPFPVSPDVNGTAK